MKIIETFKKEYDRQKSMAGAVANKSEKGLAVKTIVCLAKQAFCKHTFIGLDCINCGKSLKMERVWRLNVVKRRLKRIREKN